MFHWTTATHKKKITKVKESTEQEIFESLADSNNPAAILRLLSKCSENFIPHTTSPWCTTYFNWRIQRKIYKIKLWSTLDWKWIFFNELINITNQQVEFVLEQTKGQANSNLWLILRTGRMTTSNIRNVCKTNSDMPSVSLLKKICYRTKFRSVTTDGFVSMNSWQSVSILS